MRAGRGEEEWICEFFWVLEGEVLMVLRRERFRGVMKRVGGI